MSANLDDLGASILNALQAIEGAQSSCGVTRDRGDGATQILASTADGSANQTLGEALGLLGQADALIEQAIGLYVVAHDKVAEYRMSKGLG